MIVPANLKAELSVRSQEVTGYPINPTWFWMGWATIRLKAEKINSSAMTVLPKQELHISLCPDFMAIAGENSTHTSTRGYKPILAYANSVHYMATLP